MDIRKLLYDTFIIFGIAICIIPIATWASAVAFYHTIISLPGELLRLADKIYNENL